MKKLFALLALALLVALPACRRDKDHKKDDRRAKTTKHDGKGKKAQAQKAPAKKAAAKRAPARNTMVDCDLD
jgi:hypothetical protein